MLPRSQQHLLRLWIVKRYLAQELVDNGIDHVLQICLGWSILVTFGFLCGGLCSPGRWFPEERLLHVKVADNLRTSLPRLTSDIADNKGDNFTT